ncbi:MAG: hypothetical protein LKJ99_01600 [Acidaminococcaceae bacterium]|jgi:hypothetical protein|nr:hypothetical protein [Acidaminococcaceae bacterium]
MKLRKSFLLTLCFLLITTIAWAATPTIAVEELQPGMRGYGKTVIKGADIETFDVEVLGVTGSETGGYSILIKASGPLLEKSGGIAQGMSGSPVYIDGRLAGAVAYGRAFSDPNYCFLTPIDDMLKLFDTPDPRPSVFLPKNTPLMAAGFTRAGLAYLNENLKEFNLTSYAVPTGSGDFADVKLEPGSSVGVELIRGDINLGAIGTVTWTDENGRLLAFGHPFLQRGTADYFMTNAWIFASIPNMQSAFKVGALGNSLGRISQDRSTGIAGEIGQNAKVIPVFVSVTDKDRGEHKTSTVQLVTNEDLAPALIDSVSYNTISKTADRQGGGTSRITFDITARGGKEGEIHLKRENMFYHPTDIAKNTDAELRYACSMLMQNKFDKVTLFDVNVDVETTSQPEVAEILSAVLPKEPVVQGGVLPIKITFKPYRHPQITRIVNFKVPDKQIPGPMNLIVRSGNSTGWLRIALQKQKQAGRTVTMGGEKKLEFKDFIKEFNTADSNNEIVVDIMPRPNKAAAKAAADALIAAQKKEKEENGEEDITKTLNNVLGLRSILSGSKYKQKFSMDFISTGEINLTANVKAR